MAKWQRYVALGDSLSEGWGQPYPGVASLAWPDRLAAALEGIAFKNLAYRGMTTSQIRDTQVERALAFKPDLVSLNGGGNDVLQAGWRVETFRTTVDGILSELAPTGAQLMIFVVPDVWSIFPADKLTGPWVRGYRPVMQSIADTFRELAAIYDAVLVDLWANPGAIPPEGFSDDYLHPNALGYLYAARAAAEALGQQAGISIMGESLALPDR